MRILVAALSLLLAVCAPAGAADRLDPTPRVVPYIAFRSLSDLAGFDRDANELRTFFQLASNNSATAVQRFLTLWTPPR
jgi:hypothetical protein